MSVRPNRTSGGGARIARGAIYLIQLYRGMVSPLRPPSCRFTPTCSQYAVDALTEFGVVRGGWLATVRLLKCGPWHRGGWDPIPDTDLGSTPVETSAGDDDTGDGAEEVRRVQHDRVAGHCKTEATDFVRDIPARRGESKSSV